MLGRNKRLLPEDTIMHERIMMVGQLIFAMLLTGCAGNLADLRPATFADIPVWRLQLIVETCDLGDAEPESEMRVTVDRRVPMPLSTDPRGVFLNGPGGNYERGSFRIYDIHIDPTTQPSGDPWITTLSDVRSIRIQQTETGESWCIASLRMLVNNASAAYPLDRNGELLQSLRNNLLVDKKWSNGLWVGRDDYSVAVSDPDDLVWRVYETDIETAHPSVFLGLPLDPDQVERSGLGRFVTEIPFARPAVSTNAPPTPPGFDLWTASGEPNGRPYGLTWVAIGLNTTEVISPSEVTSGYGFPRDAAPDTFDAMFNIPNGMSYAVFAKILEGVLGDQLVRSAKGLVEWGGMYGNAHVETTIRDPRTLRVTADLNRAGRRQSGNNHIVLKFDLSISCNRRIGVLSLIPSNPSIQSSRAARGYTFGIAFIVENSSEDRIGNQLRTATFAIGCASPRFADRGIFFL